MKKSILDNPLIKCESPIKEKGRLIRCQKCKACKNNKRINDLAYKVYVTDAE